MMKDLLSLTDPRKNLEEVRTSMSGARDSLEETSVKLTYGQIYQEERIGEECIYEDGPPDQTSSTISSRKNFR